MSDTARGGSRFAEHNVVAIYESPQDARAALVLLERKGVEGADIEVLEATLDPVTNDEQRAADMAATGDISKRFTEASIVIAIAGAALGALLGYIIANDAGGLVMGLIGGVVVGGILGFLYGGYTGLTTNEHWGDTFIPGGGETTVAVHSDDPHEIDVAIQALRGTHARRLALCGRDGQLRDVA